MEAILGIPRDYAGIGIQLPLFLEHIHKVVVCGVVVMCPEQIRVEWKCVQGDELAGREFSETFDISGHIGNERFKAFLSAMPIIPQDGVVHLDVCRGRSIDVMAVMQTAGQTKHIRIIHHLLQ